VKVSITRVNQPVASWRFASLDARGYGTVQYVDPANYRVVRMETITPDDTTTTVYEDFRAENGYTFSHHYIVDDQATGDHSDANVITFQTMAVSDADLAIPPSRNFVSFPAGRTSVDLPATVDLPTIYVRVSINGETQLFVLDTSAPGIIIDPAAARRLGLATNSQSVIAMRQRNTLQVRSDVKVGDLTLHDVVMQLAPVVYPRESRVVGRLGYDFIRSVGLTIDYGKRKVSAVPADHFATPVMTNDSDILPIRVIEHRPVVMGTLNGSPASRMVVDTMALSDLVIFDYFMRRYPEAFSPRVAKSEDPLLYPMLSNTDAKGFRIDDFDLGRYHFKPFELVAIPTLKGYPTDVDGCIGPGILSHFAVGLDLVGGKLYLVHNPGQ
jgi:hypothetical protein